MQNTEKLYNDNRRAIEHGIHFKVSQKDNKGARWVNIKDDISSIFDAIKCAQSIQCFEVAIFAMHEVGGFLYWSSKNPEEFNSSVLDKLN